MWSGTSLQVRSPANLASEGARRPRLGLGGIMVAEGGLFRAGGRVEVPGVLPTESMPS